MTPGESLLRLALRRGAPRARVARPGSARPLGTLAGAGPSPARWPGGRRPRCHFHRGPHWGYVDHASMASFSSREHPLRALEPSAGHRKFASSLSQGSKRIHRFGNKSGERVQLSKLRPRQAAALEDALFAKLNDSNTNNDDRLKDPILNRSMGRKGLDWIRSISVPSSSASFGGSTGGNVGGESDGEMIAVTLRPPTLLHPQLEEAASNVARWVREATVSILKDRQEWFSDEGGEWAEVLPDDIGVTVQISPSATAAPSSPSSTKGPGRSNQGKALEQTAHVLAVYSCKGGVGKSTIATNLAYALSSLGGNVGLADLDVYGPSLPILVKPDDPTVRQSPPEMGEGMVEPIHHRGVKLMSLGYVSPDSGVPGSGPNSGAAVLRGPMAGRVVSQLLKGTNWGELDVLILDLPPGTGDVQLEVCQSLSLAGAVAVSTPSALAWADVTKGVEMFDAMGVPTVAVVENMAYFVCEGGGRHYPFGKSRSLGDKDGEEEEGVDASSSSSRYLPGPSRVFHLPVSSHVNQSNDAGTPLCCDDDNDRGVGAEEERETFSRLAEAVAADLLLLRHGMMPASMNARSGGGSNANLLTVALDEAGELEFDVPFTQLSVDNAHRQFTVRLFSNEGGYQKNISGGELRRRDPRTGEIDSSAEIHAPSTTAQGGCGGGTGKGLASMVHHHRAEDDGPDADKDDGLFPATITKKGNYGYEVEWADGAKVIYSLGAIALAAGGKALEG